MKQYIDKDEVVAEIERIMDAENENINSFEQHRNASEKQRYNTRMTLLEHILSFLNTLEVKEVNTWHLQEKENIYDAVKDWGLQTFACVMKDGTIQKFSGCLDEDCEGHINVYIDGVNDDYDDVDDIVKWIEII